MLKTMIVVMFIQTILLFSCNSSEFSGTSVNKKKNPTIETSTVEINIEENETTTNTQEIIIEEGSMTNTAIGTSIVVDPPPQDKCPDKTIVASGDQKKVLLYSPQGGGGPSPGATQLGSSFTSMGFEIEHVSSIESMTSDDNDGCKLFLTYGQIWMFLPCADTPQVPSMSDTSFTALKGYFEAGGALVVLTDANYGNAGAPHCLVGELEEFGSKDINRITNLLGLTIQSTLSYSPRNNVAEKLLQGEILKNYNAKHGTNLSDTSLIVNNDHAISALSGTLLNYWSQFITDAPSDFIYLNQGKRFESAEEMRPGVNGLLERKLPNGGTQIAFIFGSTFLYEGLSYSGENANTVFTEVAKYVRDKQSGGSKLNLIDNLSLEPLPQNIYSKNSVSMVAALKKFAPDLEVSQLWDFFANPSPLVQELALNATCGLPKNAKLTTAKFIKSMKDQITTKKTSATLAQELRCAKMLNNHKLLSDASKLKMIDVLVLYLSLPAIDKEAKELLLGALFAFSKPEAFRMVASTIGEINKNARKFVKIHIGYEISSIKTIPKEIMDKFNSWHFEEFVEELTE